MYSKSGSKTGEHSRTSVCMFNPSIAMVIAKSQNDRHGLIWGKAHGQISNATPYLLQRQSMDFDPPLYPN